MLNLSNMEVLLFDCRSDQLMLLEKILTRIGCKVSAVMRESECMPVAMMVTLPSRFYEDKYGCSGIDFLIFKPFGYKEVLWLVSEAFQYSLKLRKAS